MKFLLICHGNKLSVITQRKSRANLNLEAKSWLKGNEEKRSIRHFLGNLQNKQHDTVSK
jgi:hypothetical protein